MKKRIMAFTSACIIALIFVIIVIAFMPQHYETTWGVMEETETLALDYEIRILIKRCRFITIDNITVQEKPDWFSGVNITQLAFAVYSIPQGINYTVAVAMSKDRNIAEDYQHVHTFQDSLEYHVRYVCFFLGGYELDQARFIRIQFGIIYQDQAYTVCTTYYEVAIGG